jgi:hypothetical protein
MFDMKQSQKRSSLQHPDPVKRFASDGVAVPVQHTDSEAESVPVISADVAVPHPISSLSSPPPSHVSDHVPNVETAGGIETGHGAGAGVSRMPASYSAPPPSSSKVPVSPVGNRDRFLAGFTPLRTCCNLDLMKNPAGAKFNLAAICIAVYPASHNPDRRYVQIADSTGVVGVTVWNENVNKFGHSSVGQLVLLQKALISSHHGKKQLTLARDSIVKVGEDDKHEVCSWWQSLLMQVPKSCGAVHDMPDNSIITISGILGHVSGEMKMVNSAEKALTCLHLVDASGKLDVRTWNHMPDTFKQYVDRPLLIQRVKVTSFAGTKMCELLDFTGSVIATDFPGRIELEKFWTE